MNDALSKAWDIIKGILSVPLYFLIGLVILITLYYLGALIGYDYNADVVDIEHCRSINGTWNYETGRCTL